VIIAIDFDGTCVTHEYPKMGKDIGAVPVLREIVSNDHSLILLTMRCDMFLADAVRWFVENGIPLRSINHNPDQRKWTSSPKVYAHLYIDDAGLGIPLLYDSDVCSRPYVDWAQVRNHLLVRGVIK